jgi:hypothetical protein
MSTTLVADRTDSLVDPTARMLTIWAARLMMTIAIAHVVIFTILTHRYWVGWFAGDLRTTRYIGREMPHEVLASVAGFWQLPGSFVVPMTVLAMLISRLARTGRALPGYVGWVFGAWVVVASLVLEPSGFPLGLIPAGMLILAHRRNTAAVHAAG